MASPIKMGVRQPYFDLIRSGKKSVEGRKCSPTWASLKVGDILMITNDSNHLTEEFFFAKIIGINYYTGGTELHDDPLFKFLSTETIARVLPNKKTMEEARAVYTEWSTMDEIIRWGMLGIQLEVIH